MEEIKLEGRIAGERVIVKDGREIYDNGWYGNLEDGELNLDSIEACSLCERGKLDIYLDGKLVSFKNFFHSCAGKDPRFVCRYAVYKDLRERGLPVRIGFKGSDFKVYERGAKPENVKEIKWIVFAESEDYACGLDKLNKAFKLAQNIRAVALWAVVDNDLDVTYYIVQHRAEL